MFVFLVFFSCGESAQAGRAALKDKNGVLHLWINELSGEDHEETDLWNRGNLHYRDCTQGQGCPMTRSPFYSPRRDE